MDFYHCCVPQCGNARYNKKISFYSFPSDIYRQKQWLVKIGLDEGTQVKTHTKVCSAHFLPGDFVETSTGMKRLTKQATPSVFSWSRETPVRKPPTSRSQPTRWKKLEPRLNKKKMEEEGNIPNFKVLEEGSGIDQANDTSVLEEGSGIDQPNDTSVLEAGSGIDQPNDPNPDKIVSPEMKGPKGELGEKGEPGLRGPMGPQGLGPPIGPLPDLSTLIGEKGDKGERDDMGLPGVNGRDGSPGGRGDRGECGDLVIPGSQGPPREKRDDGVRGPSGLTIIGPPGPPGQPGLTPELPPIQEVHKGQKGDMGTAGKNGLPGPPGPAGPQRMTGPAVETGQTGLTGLRGARGEHGVAREAGIPGPQGPAGPAGMPGNDGEMGPAGRDGRPGQPVPSSAVVESTGTGTIEVGPQGPVGPARQRGQPGIQGQAGLPGARGEPELQGEKGEIGQREERGYTGEQTRSEKKNEKAVLQTAFIDLQGGKDEFQENLRKVEKDREQDAGNKMSSAPATRDIGCQNEFDMVEMLEKENNALQKQNNLLQKDKDALLKRLDSKNKENYELKEKTKDIKRHEYISKIIKKSQQILENPNRSKLESPPDVIKTHFKNIKNGMNKQGNGQTATLMLLYGGKDVFKKSVCIDDMRDLGKKPEYQEEIILPLIGMSNAKHDHLHCEEFLLKDKELQYLIQQKLDDLDDMQLLIFTQLSPCTNRLPRHPKQAKDCFTIISEQIEVLNVKTSVCFCTYYADGFDLFQKEHDRWLASALGRYDKEGEFEEQRLFWTDEGLKYVHKILMHYLPRVTFEDLHLRKESFKVPISDREVKWIVESWNNVVDDICHNDKSIRKVFPEFKDDIAKLYSCRKLFAEFAFKLQIMVLKRDMSELDADKYSQLKRSSDTGQNIQFCGNLKKKIKSDSEMSDNQKLISFTLGIQNCQELDLSVNQAKPSSDKVQKNIREFEKGQADEGKFFTNHFFIQKLQDEFVQLIRSKVNVVANEQLTLHMIEDLKKNMGSPLLNFYQIEFEKKTDTEQDTYE